MKKITPVILAAILIVISCIFIAGCVTTPAEPATPGTDQPAVSIDKEKPDLLRHGKDRRMRHLQRGQHL